MEINMLRNPKSSRHMAQHQGQPEQSQNVDSIVASLRVYAKEKNLEKGSVIHLDIVKRGLSERDSYLGSNLVSFYAKCGAFVKSHEVFDKLFMQDTVSWNALISGYVENDQEREALNYFEQLLQEGLPPDAVSFLCILKICSRKRDIGKGKKIHAMICATMLIEKNVLIGTTLIDMYTKCGVLENAQETFDQLQVHNAASWTALITGYASHGFAEESLKCFKQMQRDCVTPDAVAFACVLRVCGMLKAVEKGIEIHDQITRDGFLGKSILVGNALIDMYAKCGVLAKAQEIFDGLLVWDVVSWNTLISAYVQHENAERALSCFEQMRHEGFPANSVTFLCALKCCSSVGDAEKGKEIHAQLIRHGFNVRVITLGTALLDMYVKCGILMEAQDVFDHIRERDVISWNALITGYAELGTSEQVFDRFERMQSEGIEPNAVTFIGVLKACSSIGAVEKGKEIHERALKEGFLEKSMSICNSLVDMYAKCGYITKAHALFNQIPFHDTISWNALISGHAQHGHNERALENYECMQQEGLLPDEVTTVCILKACGSLHAAGKGKEVHAKMVKEGLLERNVFIGTALADMYGKCGALKEAEEVFQDLQVRNTVTWNALIIGYTEHGYGEEAVKCFDRLGNQTYSLNVETLICILKACSSIGAINKGRQIHSLIVGDESMEQNVLIGNALLDMYAKCGAFGDAIELFEQLPVCNVVSWTALISGYAQHGYDYEALNCYRWMKQVGVSPNEVTYVCVLKSCGNIKAADEGEVIYDAVKAAGLLETNVLVGTSLIDMYAKCGNLIKAKEIFWQLQVKNVVSWNVLLSGYVHHGFSEEALQCFEQMQDEFSPNSVTFLCVLKACGNIGSIDKGINVHRKILGKESLMNDSMIGNALVDMYAKCGVPTKAHEVFGELAIKDVISWNSLLSGYAHLGSDDDVFRLFEKMIKEGITPDTAICTILLTVCSHSGLADEGEMYFVTMNRVYGIIPSLEHCTCMVDLFGRAGHFDKAIVLIREIPAASECLPMWSAFLGACRKWGNVTLGRLAFEHIMHFNERNVGAYVSMSNIYATCEDEGFQL